MTTPDLELVDTGLLIQELMKRYDTSVIILASNQTASVDKWRSARRGDRMQLIGMLEWQKKGILDELDERVTLEGQQIIPIGCGDPDCPNCTGDPLSDEELDELFGMEDERDEFLEGEDED